MAEAKGEAAWQHTSSLLSLLYNAHRGPKSDAKCPADFDPYAHRRDAASSKPLKVTTETVKAIFMATMKN